MQKPITRSKLRRWAGKIYFRIRRYIYWHYLGIKFATSIESQLPIQIFTHKTILRRQLKDIDMWMQENKITNLKLAIKHLNGLVIHPGETFSYWRQIGKPTKAKGYLSGMVLHNGIVTAGIGGGLCQLSNLIFWMTLHTPLTVVERWRHSYDVFPDIKRNQPFGSGATCAYPNIDLQIANNTKQKFQLVLEVTNTHLVGYWRSNLPINIKYQIFEKEHLITHEWWGGYTRNNQIWRKQFDSNIKQELAEELIAENKAIMMYSPLLRS